MRERFRWARSSVGLLAALLSFREVLMQLSAWHRYSLGHECSAYTLPLHSFRYRLFMCSESCRGSRTMCQKSCLPQNSSELYYTLRQLCRLLLPHLISAYMMFSPTFTDSLWTVRKHSRCGSWRNAEVFFRSEHRRPHADDPYICSSATASQRRLLRWPDDVRLHSVSCTVFVNVSFDAWNSLSHTL